MWQLWHRRFSGLASASTPPLLWQTRLRSGSCLVSQSRCLPGTKQERRRSIPKRQTKRRVRKATFGPPMDRSQVKWTQHGRASYQDRKQTDQTRVFLNSILEHIGHLARGCILKLASGSGSFTITDCDDVPRGTKIEC